MQNKLYTLQSYLTNIQVEIDHLTVLRASMIKTITELLALTLLLSHSSAQYGVILDPYPSPNSTIISPYPMQNFSTPYQNPYGGQFYMPITLPSSQPTAAATFTPSETPRTFPPTTSPTAPQSTSQPTIIPSYKPTNTPTALPTNEPTNTPTVEPTSNQTNKPTNNPTSQPTSQPSSKPTSMPTLLATYRPTIGIVSEPLFTFQPTSAVTSSPTSEPTFETCPPTSTHPSISVLPFQPTSSPLQISFQSMAYSHRVSQSTIKYSSSMMPTPQRIVSENPATRPPTFSSSSSSLTGSIFNSYLPTNQYTSTPSTLLSNALTNSPQTSKPTSVFAQSATTFGVQEIATIPMSHDALLRRSLVTKTPKDKASLLLPIYPLPELPDTLSSSDRPFEPSLHSIDGSGGDVLTSLRVASYSQKAK